MMDHKQLDRDGLTRIADERHRHIQVKFRTTKTDLAYKPGTLAMAALCYTLMAASGDDMRTELRAAVPFTDHWPWSEEHWKPGAGDNLVDRIRELEKAGALIAAQIDVFLAELAAGIAK